MSSSYSPTAQGSQGPTVAGGVYVPGAHAMHVLFEKRSTAPAGHGVHARSDVAVGLRSLSPGRHVLATLWHDPAAGGAMRAGLGGGRVLQTVSLQRNKGLGFGMASTTDDGPSLNMSLF